MTTKELRVIVRGIAPVVREYVDQELLKFEQRLAAGHTQKRLVRDSSGQVERIVEERILPPDTAMVQKSVATASEWSADNVYSPGSFVIRGGHVWQATSITATMPGSGNAWQLIRQSDGG